MSMGSFATRTVATLVVATDGTGDFTDIQTAINALPANGGCVYIKEGTYNITVPIVIDSNNVSIMGCGRSTIIAQQTNNADCIQVSNCTGNIIENVYLHGPALIGGYAVNYNTVDHSYIRFIWFDNFTYGIYLTESTYNYISGNETTGTGIAGGIWLTSNSDYNIISSNMISGCASAGIYLNVSEHCIISSNICSDNDIYGIEIISLYVVVNSNTCSGNTSHGIYLTAGRNNIVDGNDVFDNGGDGISLMSDDNDIISNNRCRDNTNEINISNAFCDKNLVLGNICLGAHVAAIVDNGTNTHIGHNITA